VSLLPSNLNNPYNAHHTYLEQPAYILTIYACTIDQSNNHKKKTKNKISFLNLSFWFVFRYTQALAQYKQSLAVLSLHVLELYSKLKQNINKIEPSSIQAATRRLTNISQNIDSKASLKAVAVDKV